MKPAIALILLLLHVNFSLMAQVDEVDIFDKNGQQQEDINSLVQYIDVILLKHTHHNTRDTDDDNARYLHMARCHNYVFYPTNVSNKDQFHSSEIYFPCCSQEKLNSVCLDFQGPPPKA